MCSVPAIRCAVNSKHFLQGEAKKNTGYQSQLLNIVAMRVICFYTLRHATEV